MNKELMQQVLNALKGSLDPLQIEFAVFSENYSHVLSRKSQLDCMKINLEAHKAAILALESAVTQPEPHNLQKRLTDLHLYEEIGQYYAKCNPGPENLRDWVAERMDRPATHS